ncbi:hypothetical protein LRAMOSA09021 [Lichtheimia ramosa]|uniref:Uncharacterized protein n=1 Tax=Lichtheimia ramosa TaxID=688394 RepID=A0A077WHN6_9FUNG|nr:hypothetical protein LRAMOSA09021 [Lichtheimia ramosa]
MHFKLSLIATLAIGSLTVLGQGPGGAGASAGGAAPAGQGGGQDIGAVANDAQKDQCFGLCNDQDIKSSFKCYEKCLKTVLDGGDPTANPEPKVGQPVGTLEQRTTCFKKCEKQLIKQGENCYVDCLNQGASGTESPAAGSSPVSQG